MTEKSILDALNAAGEALKACGESSILFGFYPKSDLHIADTFTCRLDLPSTTGVQGHGPTMADAYKAALIERANKQVLLDIEAMVRAEVSERLNRKAA